MVCGPFDLPSKVASNKPTACRIEAHVRGGKALSMCRNPGLGLVFALYLLHLVLGWEVGAGC